MLINDVVPKAIKLGKLNGEDISLVERLEVISEMTILRVEEFIGYEVPDKLLSVIAEMVVTQIDRYGNLQGANSEFPVARISRGDYTVEHDTNTTVDILNSYEWILKKYKKLKTL